MLIKRLFRAVRGSKPRAQATRADLVDRRERESATTDAPRLSGETAARCPVCRGACALLGSVDFNKSCEEARGRHLPASGIAVEYHRCGQCDFAFAPEFAQWRPEQFRERIYNADYKLVDPDYIDERPRSNASALVKILGKLDAIEHLDYGGGEGLMSALLRDRGWHSRSYDPFVDRATTFQSLGRFELVTAFEVFEHVPDVQQLMSDLCALLDQPGLVLFSTLLSDGQMNAGEGITWWYASPRNGHISLFSRRSLEILGAQRGLHFGSLSENLHAYWRQAPPWAGHLFSRPVAGR